MRTAAQTRPEAARHEGIQLGPSLEMIRLARHGCLGVGLEALIPGDGKGRGPLHDLVLRKKTNPARRHAL